MRDTPGGGVQEVGGAGADDGQPVFGGAAGFGCWLGRWVGGGDGCGQAPQQAGGQPPQLRLTVW